MERTVILIVMLVISIGAVITHGFGTLVATRFRFDKIMRRATVLLGTATAALAVWLLFHQ